MKITKTWLEERNACTDQIAIFVAEWPKGVTVTKEALIRAGELRLNLYWFVHEVLKGQTLIKYNCTMDSSRIEYMSKYVRVRAWIEYMNVRASAIMAGLNKISKTE